MARKTLTARQMQKMDTVAIEQYGIASLCLMENAGRAVADEARRMIKGAKRPRVCIVCGAGNNAGDGFVAARHLINAGVDTEIFLLCDPQHLKNGALVNYNILKKSRAKFRRVRRVTGHFTRPIAAARLVVDAIFGVGLNRNVEGVFAEAIEAINAHAGKILAVDVPSGLDATTGRIFGTAVRAKATVTFTFPKTGFIKCLGPKFCGKIKTVDIGIPLELTGRFRRS